MTLVIWPCQQVELQRALHELDTKELLLDTSHRTIEKQEATLQTIEAELNDREQENYLLRKSVDITKWAQHEPFEDWSVCSIKDRVFMWVEWLVVEWTQK